MNKSLLVFILTIIIGLTLSHISNDDYKNTYGQENNNAYIINGE